MIEEEAFEREKGDVLPGGLEGFTHEQEAGDLVRDRERVAVSAIAELELAFKVGAPRIVCSAWRARHFR